MTFIKNFLARFKKCTHVKIVLDDNGNVFEATNLATIWPGIAVGDWGEPEPHPVPKFSKTHKIQRQPVAAICHCTACGEWFITHGHNQRDYDDKQTVIDFAKYLPKGT